MAFKKIVLQNCDYCPKCHGKSGIKFTLKAKIKCVNYWGASPGESINDGVQSVDSGTKTAVCIDCNTRFEIL